MASKYDPQKTAQMIQKYQDQYNQAATRKIGASSDSNSRRMYYAAIKLKELGGKVPEIDRPMYGLAYKPTAWEKRLYKDVTPAAGQYYQKDLSEGQQNKIKAEYDKTREQLRSARDKAREAAKSLQGRDAQLAAKNKAFEDYNTALRSAIQQRSQNLRGYIPANVKTETPVAAPQATPVKQAEPAKQVSAPAPVRQAAPGATQSYSLPKYIYKPGEGFIKQTAMKSGGKVKSGASRGDGCAIRGKTRGRMI